MAEKFLQLKTNNKPQFMKMHMHHHAIVSKSIYGFWCNYVSGGHRERVSKLSYKKKI